MVPTNNCPVTIGERRVSPETPPNSNCHTFNIWCRALSTGGPRRDHARRDWNLFLSKLDYGLTPYQCQFDVKDPLKLDRTSIDLPVLLPHEVVGALFSFGWDMFSAVLLGGIPEGLSLMDTSPARFEN